MAPARVALVPALSAATRCDPRCAQRPRGLVWHWYGVHMRVSLSRRNASMPKLGSKIAMFRLHTLKIRCERTSMGACLSTRRAVQAERFSVPLRHRHRTGVRTTNATAGRIDKFRIPRPIPRARSFSRLFCVSGDKTGLMRRAHVGGSARVPCEMTAEDGLDWMPQARGGVSLRTVHVSCLAREHAVASLI